MGTSRRPRSLRDLGVLGRTLVFDDPHAAPPTEGCEDCTAVKGACGEHGGRQLVWLQKLNPAEHESAVRKANAVRARTRAAFADHDSDEYLDLVDELDEILAGPEVLELLIAEERAKIQASVEAELELGVDTNGEPSEWGRDGYLQGLREAWIDHGRDLYVEDENDADARRILDEFKRFGDAVAAIVDPQLEDLREQFRALPPESLRERVQERFVKLRCEQAWITEFERAELWLGARKPCDACLAGEPHSFVHDDFYFASGRAEVDQLTQEIRDRLLIEYHDLVTEVQEGKGSPGNPASSGSSESPEAPATAAISGPEVAVA